jgi:hypothetical protein
VPTFSPGVEKTAKVTVRNRAASSVFCKGQLYFGTQKMAEVSFSLSGGSTKAVSFPVTMPTEGGTYTVTAKILVGGEVIATHAGQDVKIAAEFDPWSYDTNKDGVISKAEILVALTEYFDGLLTKDQIMELIQLYYDGIKAALTVRLFAVTTPAAGHGEFAIYCQVENVANYEVDAEFQLLGTIEVAQLTKDIDETVSFTLKPGETYLYRYRDSTFEGDYVQAKVHSEWGLATPTLEFVAGYYASGVSLVATEIGADYVVLRYTSDSVYDDWDFGLETDPAEQTIRSSLEISDNWPTIYHLVTGLLPGRTYKAWCRDGTTGRTEFTT